MPADRHPEFCKWMAEKNGQSLQGTLSTSHTYRGTKPCRAWANCTGSRSYWYFPANNRTRKSPLYLEMTFEDDERVFWIGTKGHRGSKESYNPSPPCYVTKFK